MPVSAATLSLLIKAGLQGDDLIAVVASIDCDMQQPEKARSSAALRQARYRDNQKNAESVTSDVTSDVTRDAPSPDKETSPTPPKEINPYPIFQPQISNDICPPSDHKSEKQKFGNDWPKDAFDRWYRIYPRRTARGAAEKAFEKARRSGEVDFPTLILATERFARAPPDPQFIPHPATWLNRKQWLDEPNHYKPKSPIMAAFDALDSRIARRANLGAERDDRPDAFALTG